MARPGGLGRGLGALIPTGESSSTGTYRELLLDSVVVNQYQPRKHFEDEALSALTASIREFGVLQPIVVRPLDDGRFELIAGERRWRASRQAGLSAIPAVVRTADDQESLVQAVVENIHREDLNPLEEAAAFRQLLEDFGVTHEALAQKLGRGRATISNTMRLLQLPVSVQRPLVEGHITAGHARALLGCPDRQSQEKLLASIISQGWSVRAVEEAVRTLTAEAGGEKPDRGPGETRPAALLELEDLLSEHLATRVQISMQKRRGKLTIEFADMNDLERIYIIIQQPAQ
jgi:ParB family transcriptional regulator, chromosome partitioning protein